MQSLVEARAASRPRWWRIALAALFWASLAAALSATPLAGVADLWYAKPLMFRARELIGMATPVAPSLKIYTQDDTTVSKLGTPELSPGQWIDVLSAIASRKPRAIYIDKLFSIGTAGGGVDPQLAASIAALDVPIVVGAFVREGPLTFRTPLELTGEAYSRERILAKAEERTKRVLSSARAPHVYGPGGIYAQMFTRVGHILGEEQGRLAALIPIGDKKVLPHLSLVGDSTLEVDGDQLHFNGHHVPVDRELRVRVNFLSAAACFQRAVRLLGFFDRAGPERTLSHVQRGDTVLILPAMYTGNTDWATTPFGLMPGGFVIASMLNSAVNGVWITPTPLPWAWLLLLAACGALLRLAPSAGAGWALTLGGVLGWQATVVGVFSLVALELDPVFPAFAFGGAALTSMAQRYRIAELMVGFVRWLEAEKKRMQSELESAAAISRSLIPESPPAWPEVGASVYYRPATEASGDWFAFEAAPSGRFLHFVLCDITGHGMHAAIVAATASSVLTMLAQREPERLESADFLTALMSALHQVLFQHGRGAHTTTFLGITFEPRMQQLSFITAGHPPPLFVRRQADGKPSVEPLVSRHDILGMAPEMAAPRLSVHAFAPGDELLCYTDGLSVKRHLRTLRDFIARRSAGGNGAPPPDAPLLARTLLDAEMAGPRPAEDDDACIVWFQAKALAAALDQAS